MWKGRQGLQVCTPALLVIFRSLSPFKRTRPRAEAHFAQVYGQHWLSVNCWILLMWGSLWGPISAPQVWQRQETFGLSQLGWWWSLPMDRGQGRC